VLIVLFIHTLKFTKMNNSIAIHESKNSEKVITFCTGVYQLLQYCSEKQAKKIQDAANNGKLYGAYFTKTGKIRATYI